MTGDIRGLSHEEINADIVVINPPHRPVRSKTREGNRIKEFKLLPSSTTEAAYIELATRAIADGGELIALSSARWMTDEDNSRAVRRLQKAGSITDIHLYRRQNISCSRLFGRNAQHLDATTWRYQKGAVGLPATSVFHETTGPDEPHGATIRVVTPHEKVLPATGGNHYRQAIEIPRSRLDDEIQRILRNLPKLKNTGLHIARGRLSPYRERERFTRDAGSEPVALITANNIVQAQSTEGTTWKLKWPSQRPNSLNYYNADRDSAPMNPIQPGSYVLITGPAGNAREPCPRAALVDADKMRMPFVVTQQMHVIGMRAQDERVPAIAPLDDEHARGLATWLNSRLIRSHFRINVKCGDRDGASGNEDSDTGQHAPAGDRPAHDEPLRRRADRSPNPADKRRDAGARRQRIDRAGLGGAPPEARRGTEDRELRSIIGHRGNRRAPERGPRRSRRRRHPAADQKDVRHRVQQRIAKVVRAGDASMGGTHRRDGHHQREPGQPDRTGEARAASVGEHRTRSLRLRMTRKLANPERCTMETTETRYPMNGNERVTLRIQAGAGGEEARNWTEQLGRMYQKYAERHG